jgi:surface antigen
MRCRLRGRAALAACFVGALLIGAEAQAGLTCVPFARAVSEVKLEGDAWVWWQAAAGRYHRSQQPAVGSVLVMKRTARLRHGHVAVVAAVLSSREILLDHANWSPGEIARGERAIDVSPQNDWSEVRVWHDPSASYGVNVYPAYGFVHPAEPRIEPVSGARVWRGKAAPPAEAQRKLVVVRPVLPEFKPRQVSAARPAAPTKRRVVRGGA